MYQLILIQFYSLLSLSFLSSTSNNAIIDFCQHLLLQIINMIELPTHEINEISEIQRKLTKKEHYCLLCLCMLLL